MARSRLDLRREQEAAEAREAAGEKVPGEKAPATRRRKAAGTAAAPARKKRVKEKAVQRKRLVWGVFNPSMKEEARFPYDQRDAAEERVRQLRERSKKLYFIQPIKELIGEAPAPVKTEPLPELPEEEAALEDVEDEDVEGDEEDEEPELPEEEEED